MKNNRLLVALVASLVCVLVVVPAASAQKRAAQLTVFAAASLNTVMPQIDPVSGTASRGRMRCRGRSRWVLPRTLASKPVQATFSAAGFLLPKVAARPVKRK